MHTIKENIKYMLLNIFIIQLSLHLSSTKELKINSHDLSLGKGYAFKIRIIEHKV